MNPKSGGGMLGRDVDRICFHRVHWERRTIRIMYMKSGVPINEAGASGECLSEGSLAARSNPSIIAETGEHVYVLVDSCKYQFD